jgi:hypothetical protein
LFLIILVEYPVSIKRKKMQGVSKTWNARWSGCFAKRNEMPPGTGIPFSHASHKQCLKNHDG